jgi:hypothetical protein
MTRCKVLWGPVILDRSYNDGETVELEDADANQLAQWGIVEIIKDAVPTATVSPPLPTPDSVPPAPASTPAPTPVPVVEATIPATKAEAAAAAPTPDPGSTDAKTKAK